MSYVAKKALKFGDGWIQPGEEVPEQEGRNYGLMLEHGEIVVHDDTLDLSDSDVRKELAAARKELKELRAQVDADENAAADVAAAEAPEGDDNADGETAQPEGAQRPSDSDPSDPEDETTEPPAAAGEGSDPASGDASPYEDMKQPELKKLLDDRKIEYKRGPVKNEVLVALLVESDAKSE